MTKIKLKDWADKNGLSYLTANRHFHAGMIPGASQLDSGTILVEDDSPEQTMPVNSPNDAMSLFLKKTVEYSKNNSSVEDFAAYVISNFTIKLNNASEPSPKYSKNRPKPEEVQKHFQKFLPDKEAQDRLKAIKNLVEKQNVNEGPAAVVDPEVHNLGELGLFNTTDIHTFSEELDDAEAADAILTKSFNPTSSKQILDHMYGPDATTTGGLVNRSVDSDTTPQQINYTGSNSQVFSSNCVVPSAAGVPTYSAGVATNGTVIDFGDGTWSFTGQNGVYNYNNPIPMTVAFQPTQKELLSSAKVIETAEDNAAPRGKRGRKSFKKV